MKIRLLSDLHLEFRNPLQQITELLERVTDGPAPDLTILAGDVAPLRILVACTGTRFLQKLCDRSPVVYVLGNHELYGHDALNVDDDLEDVLKAVDRPGFFPLRRQTVTVGGQRIVGTTLYWPKPRHSQRIQDYTQVRNFVPWVYDQAALDEAFLRREVREGDVVVTHLMPSTICIDPRYMSSSINCFFVHPMDDLIEKAKPAVWCSGHTHSGFDLRLGSTRLVCNPLGYPGEAQSVPFNPVLEFEV